MCSVRGCIIIYEFLYAIHFILGDKLRGVRNKAVRYTLFEKMPEKSNMRNPQKMCCLLK